MDKEYVVTLHNKEDLEQFYNEMKLTNFPLVMKRPLSRNTHYMMTEEQANKLRQDPRVWGVEAVDNFKIKRQIVNNEPYVKSGNFWKDDTVGPSYTVSSDDLQWGHIHCAGDQAQRGKNAFGPVASGWSYEQVNASIEVFNSGRHVDVVIVDDPVSYDSEEWYSPTTNQTRFVQYQWFNELNTLVNSIDDDLQVEPTGTITYGTNAATPQYHGIHVTGTACGQHYGWAREANIYNLAVTDPWPSGQFVGALLIFDYLRAFHQSKGINPETGKKNPTITNHSYGGIYAMPNDNLQFGSVTQVFWRGTTYSAGNPGPSGWTQAGVEQDFGLRFGLDAYPAWSAAVAADVQDAIDEGIVVIGAAGNDNLLMAEVDDDDWNNQVSITGVGTIYYNRGAWPNSPDSGSINVGALSKQGDFRRSTYTQFGPAIDVFAPGDNILSAYGNTGGLNDSKYPAGNYFYPIQGTSMASPQVCGLAACLATGKDRFNNTDLRKYLNDNSIDGDMTFDLFGGGLDDNSCRQGSPNRYLHVVNPRKTVGYLTELKGERTTGQTYPRASTFNAPAPDIVQTTYTFTVTNNGSASWLFTGSDAQNTYSNNSNVTIYCSVGDILEFNVNASGHPFWIKTQPQTGTGFGVTTGTITGQATQVGTVTWDTTGVTATSYHIMCQFHSTMRATIIIS
jgi:hypothetical protein